MIVFSPLTYGRACFLLAVFFFFFREMGRFRWMRWQCGVGRYLFFSLSFFLGFDWKLVSLLGWSFVFFGESGGLGLDR